MRKLGPIHAGYSYQIEDLPQEQRAAIPSPDPCLGRANLESSVRSSARPFIPVCEPDICAEALENLRSCVEENWISSAGRFVSEFERKYASLVGVKHCISTSSGTTALQLLLAASGVGPGDEVIIPTFAMVAVASSVVHLGARPVFVDCTFDSENVSIPEIVERITDRTRAIIVVHTYGKPVDVSELCRRVDTLRVAVIEDAAEAHGAAVGGRVVGTLCYGAAFSFYANKIVSTGEGGAVTTDNDELAAVCRTLRDHAFSAERHFWHRYRGYNFRMTNLQAAVGVAQLDHFGRLCEARRHVASFYARAFSQIDALLLPQEEPETRHAFWVYFIRTMPHAASRDALRQSLAKYGIETRTAFIPIHLQPAYREFVKPGDRFPNAEAVAATGLYLPSSSRLTDAELDYIGRIVCEVVS